MTAQPNSKEHKNAKARRKRSKESSSSDSPSARPDKGGGGTAKPQGSLMERTVRYLNGILAETKRVSWPSKPEVIAGTITSIFILMTFAIWLGGLDFILKKIIH